MRLTIVGVGQALNFDTKQMEDTLLIETPSGIVNIPTTNEVAQQLVSIVMGPLPEVPDRDESGDRGRWEEEYPYDDDDESIPEGASVFATEEAVRENPKETVRPNRPTGPNLGRVHNAPDRSGVPSIGISRVDEAGNPILPEGYKKALEDSLEEEEDPGEQI